MVSVISLKPRVRVGLARVSGSVGHGMTYQSVVACCTRRHLVFDVAAGEDVAPEAQRPQAVKAIKRAALDGLDAWGRGGMKMDGCG